MRHAHLAIIAMSACLLLQARAQNTPAPHSEIPRFDIAAINRTLLTDNIHKELQILHQCVELLQQDKPAAHQAKILDNISALNTLQYARPVLIERAAQAGEPLYRSLRPDLRSLYVRLDSLRRELQKSKPVENPSFYVMLEKLPIYVIDDATRLAGRDKMADLIQRLFKTFKDQGDILRSVRDKASAQAAIASITEARARHAKLEALIAQQGDVYLTREDLYLIQKHHREGWEPLRVQILHDSRRIEVEDYFGVPELKPLLPR